jgi:RNA polymerase sigma factor (sigma-70 family)
MNTQKNTSEKINFEWIQKALLRLPETQREAVILKFINEKTTKEIAEYLEKTETAVRVLISRGIKTLQEVLKDLEKRNKKT